MIDVAQARAKLRESFHRLAAVDRSIAETSSVNSVLLGDPRVREAQRQHLETQERQAIRSALLTLLNAMDWLLVANSTESLPSPTPPQGRAPKKSNGG